MPGLEDLYREIILDHYNRPRNKGELAPPAHRADGMNPLCGDEISVYLLLDGTGDDAIVKEISIGGQGCSISQASASMMTTAVKGKTVTEAKRVLDAFKAMMGIRDEVSNDAHETDTADNDEHAEVKLGDLEALRGVVKFPVRIKCATLAWNTMGQGISEIQSH